MEVRLRRPLLWRSLDEVARGCRQRGRQQATSDRQPSPLLDQLVKLLGLAVAKHAPPSSAHHRLVADTTRSTQ